MKTAPIKILGILAKQPDKSMRAYPLIRAAGLTQRGGRIVLDRMESNLLINRKDGEVAMTFRGMRTISCPEGEMI